MAGRPKCLAVLLIFPPVALPRLISAEQIMLMPDLDVVRCTSGSRKKERRIVAATRNDAPRDPLR
jgi:hypothetical protein